LPAELFDARIPDSREESSVVLAGILPLDIIITQGDNNAGYIHVRELAE
jgi:hypothetical protein